MKTSLRIALTVPILASAGCDLQPEPITKYEYTPYAGEAYPDRRAKVTIPAGGAALVTDSYSDEISVIGLQKGDVIATVPVGRDPVGLDGPHHLVVDPKGGFVFTALSYPQVKASGPHASHGLSVQPGYVQRLALDDFRILGQVRVDTNPGDIVLSEDGKRIVVSHFDLQKAIDNAGNPDLARATLALVDPAEVLETDAPEPLRIPSVCIAPHGVALSRPDGARAYVACYGEDALAVVDLDQGTVLDRVPVSPGAGGGGDPSYGPYSAVLSPDGATVAIGDTVSKDVRFFDVASSTIDATKTLKTLGAPYFPAWSTDGKLLYVPLQTPHGIVTSAP